VQQTTSSGVGTAPARSGWVDFAGVMTIITGAFNGIDGLVAYYRTSYFRDVAPVGNLRFWAFVWVVFGVLQLGAGFAILGRQAWGRWFAIATVSVNAFLQLIVFINNPWWSAIIIAYDIAIFYALAVHWRSRSVVA
jgi:hypothetical protein